MYTGLGFTTTGSTDSGGGAMDIAQGFIGDIPLIGPLLNTITGFVHIGTGRNEADQITPTQNEFGAFLAQVSLYITASTSIPGLQQCAANLDAAWSAFQEFIFNKSKFPDGRASAGAFNTLSPQVEGFKTKLRNKISQLGGGSAAMLPQQGTGAGIQSLQPAIYGVPAFPQAGTLPYTPPVQYPQQFSGSAFDNSSLMTAALAGGLAYLFLKSR